MKSIILLIVLFASLQSRAANSHDHKPSHVSEKQWAECIMDQEDLIHENADSYSKQELIEQHEEITSLCASNLSK